MGINCNLNDLAAAIGSVQVKRLPQIIADRRKIGEGIKAGLRNCKAVSLGWQVPDSKPVYWFLRFKIDIEQLKVDKASFCKALDAEGIKGIMPSYRHIHCEKPWFENKAVFGKNGFPWNCSDYKGNKNPEYNMVNAIKATDSHFNILMNESFSQDEIEDILTAVEKVEKAYLK